MNHFGAELRNSQNIRKMTLEAQLICFIQKTARANPQYLKFEMTIFQKILNFYYSNSILKTIYLVGCRYAIDQAPVVQRVDSAIHCTNHYPADKCYQKVIALSSG